MRPRHILALFLGSLGILLYLDRVCIGVALPRIQGELHLSPEQLGWVSLAFSVGYAAFEIPGGRWGDSIGPRRMLAGIVLGWSLFTALTGMTHALWTLLLARLLFGAAEAGALPNVAAVIARWFPARARARAFGAFLAASQLGAALAPILVVPIQQRHGWRAGFFVFGAAGVVWAVAWYAWLRDSPAEDRAPDLEVAPPAARLTPSSLRALLREPTLWALSASFCCGIYAVFFGIFWAPTFLVRARGFSEAELRWSAIMWIAGVVCSYGGGAVSDAWTARLGRARGRRAAGAAGLVVVALGYALAAVTRGKIATLAALTLSTAAFGLTQATSFAVCVDVGRERSGTVAGVMNTAGQLGGSISAVVFGYLVKATGSYETPLAVMSAVAAFGALCWLGVDASKPLGARAWSVR
jgi:ACS family glucarate transporter-like MFS transporter